MSDHLLAECEAMAPLLAAFARGTKKSKLRQLAVVCQNGHTLSEVFPTSVGPHVLWHQVHNWPTRTTLLHAAPLWSEFDADLGVADAVYLDIIAACRCTEQAGIHGQVIAQWLSTGQGRVVYSVDD